MNAADEPPPDRPDSARSGPSATGLAGATLRALRAGNRPEQPTAEEPTAEELTDAAPEPVADEPVEADDVSADSAPVSLTKTRTTTSTAKPARAPKLPARTRKKLPTYETTETAAVSSTSRRSVITPICAVVAVAALVFAVVAGVLWWHAGHSSQRSIGVAREQIDADARLAIVTVNTSDYQHPSAALDNWLGASTGSLHAQFSQSRTTAVKLLAEAKMVTKASVLDTAVTGLDLKKGTATVIASVNVTRTPATGAVSTVRNRFRASMTRTGGQWKLSDLTVVAVSLS